MCLKRSYYNINKIVRNYMAFPQCNIITTLLPLMLLGYTRVYADVSNSRVRLVVVGVSLWFGLFLFPLIFYISVYIVWLNMCAFVLLR